MSLTKKRQFWSRLIYSPLTMAVLSILAIMLAFSVYDRYVIERETAGRLVDVQKNLEKSKERQAALKEQVQYLSEDRGVEAELRKHFDVAKEGERIVILVDKKEDDKQVISTTSEKLDENGDSSWFSWWPW